MDTHDECLSYTSLKDLLPASSPSNSLKDSWREISIKDPLVQHAAWAYLQPMMTAYEDVEGGSFFRRIKRKCCGLFECFNDVVKSLFSSEQGNEEEDEYKLE